ncbi:MAG: type VI secretion protein IcmF/TssM N-terminal domain-containing protein, partial [Bacteroidota bacterium]
VATWGAAVVAGAVLPVAGGLLEEHPVVKKIRSAESEAAKKAKLPNSPQWEGPKKKPAPDPAAEGKKLFGFWKKKKPDTTARDFARFFRHEVRRLKKVVGTKNAVYDFPWYLMVGEEGSGKTTLLKNSGQIPWSAPSAEDFPGSAFCNWWCSDRAVVLDLKGDFVLDSDGAHHKAGWRKLMSMLQRYRRRRPIDGVILTISASDFIGPDMLEHDELARKGAEISERLRDLENKLGMSVPVYPVITQCDAIPGFTSFCEQMPPQRHDEIFGWSSPYTLETSYSPAWVEQAFGAIGEVGHWTQLEMLSKLPAGADGDMLFLFADEFQSIAPGVQAYLDPIFRCAHSESRLAMRGIYFVGDTNSPVSPEDNTLIELEAVIAAGAPPVPAAPVADAPPPEPVLCFTHKLFAEKIFAEPGIAYPLASRGLSKNRTVLALQIATALLLLTAIAGYLFSYPRLRQSKERVTVSLETLHHDLANVNSHHVTDDEYVRYANDLLDGMNSIDTNSLKSAFFPTSYFSDIDNEFHRALATVFESVMLKAIYVRLGTKTNDLNYWKIRAVRPRPDSVLAYEFNMENTPEYLNLRGFVRDLDNLEKNAGIYNDLQESRNLADVGGLVKYLFDKPLPPSFMKQDKYYRNALRFVQLVPFAPDSLTKEELAHTARVLTDQLLEKIFTRNAILARVRDINRDISALEGSRSDGFAGMRIMTRISSGIVSLRAALADPATAWISRPEFTPDSTLNTLLTELDGSTLLGGNKPGAEFLDACRDKFKLLKADIVGERSEIIGGPIVTAESADNALRTVVAIDTLRASIDELMAQKFMKAPGGVRIEDKRNPGNRVFWNSEELQLAIKMRQPYDDFSTGGLTFFPVRLQSAVGLAARSGLDATVSRIVNESEQAQPSYATEGDVQREMQGLIAAQPDLSKIQMLFDGLQLGSGEALRNVLKNQSRFALQDLQILLLNSGAYFVEPLRFHIWRTEQEHALGPAGIDDSLRPLSMVLIHANDDSDIATYLSGERAKVENLAVNIARPFIAVLPQLGVGDFSAVGFWQSILNQLARYGMGVGTSSLRSLEDLFLQLNIVSDENYRQRISARDTTDYFLRRREYLRAQLVAEFEKVHRRKAVLRYHALQDTFNLRMRDAFPFAEFDDRTVHSSVTLDELRRFFVNYDYFRLHYRDIWDGWKDSTRTRPAYDFLESMTHVRTFLDPLLSNDSDRAAYALEVVLRDNIPGEIGFGNQIADWRFQVGGQDLTIEDAIRKNAPLRAVWRVGDSISIRLRWAKNATVIPSDVPFGNGKVQHDGRTVIYSFRDPWSLIHLLSMYKTTVTAKQPRMDNKPVPQLLGFTINTVQNVIDGAQVPTNISPSVEKTRVFIRVGVLRVDRRESVAIPQFPTSFAPDLPW